MSAYEEGVERLEEIREASRVLWRTPDGMEVPVEITGHATWAWGRFNITVRPVGGTGSKSVSLENLRGVEDDGPSNPH